MRLKQILSVFAIIVGLAGCQFSNEQSSKIANPRIVIAGLAIECSTFSPAQTHEEGFRARRGEEIYAYYPYFHGKTRFNGTFYPAIA